MTRKPFRMIRALLGACPKGTRAASGFAPGGLAWLTALLLAPACALALDIGEIQVHSALNQLFDARIPLPTLAPEELSKISVRLAPAPMFKEFNLERAPVLTNLVFSVEYNAEGQVYVKVVSTKPIQEPSLGLLVEFGWPRGKTFREFSVFLDPVRRLAQRPDDRSKTVLNAPTAAPPAPLVPSTIAAAPPVEPAPVPPTIAAAPPVEPAPVPSTIAAAPPAPPVPSTIAPEPEPNEPDAPAGDSANPGTVAMTGTEDVEASGEPPLPVEAPPATVRAYRPGDTYGPVAVGEGLWGIALKVRPDPGITRDQMMQALFQANPDAFGKAGVNGLKTGAMLRLPSFREIADITGSATARRLAEMEQQSAVAAATPLSPAPVATESPASKAGANALEVFLLEPPASLEPTVVMTSPPAPPPEAVQPVSAPEPVASEPVASEPVASEPVASEPVASEPVAPEPVASEPVASEPVAPASEPAVASPEPKMAESTAPPVAVLAEPDQEVLLEPVSVTPLLFLAVSEMMATLAQPPAMTTVSEAETPTLEPKRETSAAPESSVMGSEIERPLSASTVALEPPVAPMNAASLLAVVEKRWPRMEEQDWLLQRYLASDITVPMVAEFAESLLPTPAISASAIASPAAKIEEVPALAVSDSPRLPAAVPAEPSAKAAEPSPHPYQAGDQYGPIAPNERLWDIAAKVRPDPAISKEHMMKALFKANPQAFSKPDNMDRLKVGATLRIPTLQEIVIYTGSKAANQLLEQQWTVETPAAPVAEPAPEPAAPPEPAAEVLPAPEPAEPPPPVVETLPAPEPAEPPPPVVETLPAPEPAEPPPPVVETLPAPEPVAPPVPAETPPALEPAPAVPGPASEPAPPASAAEAPPTSIPSSAR